MALPVEIPSSNQTMNLCPNIMGNASTRRFGLNQPGGRAIGWIPQMESPVVMTAPNQTMNLHHNTMGDAPYVPFCRNQQWGQIFEGDQLKTIKLFFTHNNQLSYG